jgi:hypothetical protein
MLRMATLELNLPKDLKASVECRARPAGYASIDQYSVSLLQAGDLAPVSDAMKAELLRSLDSGPAVEITPDYIANVRQPAKTRRR